MNIELFEEAADRLVRRHAGLEVVFPVPWKNLQRTLQAPGFGPGLHQLIGPPGTFKSTIARDLLLHGIREGHYGAYIGLELSIYDIMARLLSYYSSEWRFDGKAIPWGPIQRGDLKDPEWIREASDKLILRLKKGKVMWEMPDPRAVSLEYFTNQIKWLEQKAQTQKVYKTPLMVVDFVQLIKSKDEAWANAAERVSDVSYHLRLAGAKHNVAILGLSSTARSNYDKLMGYNSDGGKGEKSRKASEMHPRELIGTAKSSGDSEYAGDTTVVLAKDEFGIVQLGVAKDRLGDTASLWATLHFDGHRIKDGPPPVLTMTSKEKVLEFAKDVDTWLSFGQFVEASGLTQGEAVKLHHTLLDEGVIEQLGDKWRMDNAQD